MKTMKTTDKKGWLAQAKTGIKSLGLALAAAFAIQTATAGVAKIGTQEYNTLAEAVAAAEADQTIEIFTAGEYALPGIPKKITLKAADGVVYNCAGTGSICSIPNGCTFVGGVFNMGQSGYHGWHHAGHIFMNGCTLNGLFLSYGDMTFTGCHFVQTEAEYNMWTYGGNISYVNCDFTFKGKCINVYRESATAYTVSFSGCTFTSDTKNKAAVNVKATCKNGAILSYTVNVTDCQVNDPAMFPAPAPLNNGLLVIDGLVQVDDIDEAHQPDNTTVFLNGNPAYPAAKPAVAQIGEKKYDTLAAAVAAVADSETIELLDDVTLAEKLVISNGRTFTLDLGGKTLKGRVNVSGAKLTVKNGTIDADSMDQALNMYGTDDKAYAGQIFTYVKVEEDVTLRGAYGLCFLPRLSNAYFPLCYGVKVDFYGKSECVSPVYVSGNMGNDQNDYGNCSSYQPEGIDSRSKAMALYGPELNVYGTLTCTGSGDENPQGITLSGMMRVNVYDGAVITGSEGIGMKSGVVNVYGGTITSTGAKQVPVTGVNNGSEASGAAISVTSYYTNDNYDDRAPISVTITGGNLVGTHNAAVLVAHSYENSVAKPFKQGVELKISGGTFQSGDGQAVIYIADTVAGDSEIYPTKFITGGSFSTDPAAFLVEGYQAAENEGMFTVCTQIKKDDGTTSVPALEQQSGSSVDEKKLDQVVQDQTIKDAIKQETVVSGVKLTTTPKMSGETEVAPAGMQAVVNAAKAKNPELATALEAETASMVTVAVDVAVSPVKFDGETQEPQNVASFNLTPKATVTVVNTTGTGTEAVTTSKSETVPVSNDMIDQTAGIAVTIFTGFQPEMIVHKDENGKVIETFTADQIVWNADKKTATVMITHFSTLEAVKVSYAAQTGDALYGTLAEAFAAVPGATPTTVKVLKDLTLTEGVTFASGKTATLDFAGRTITGGTITSAGALTLTGGTTDAALVCSGSGTMAITGGDYATALPAATDPAATNAGPFLVSGGTFVSEVPWAYCAPGYEPQAKGDGKYGVKDANIYIRDISAAQRYPWNGYVDITLDVCWSTKATARLFIEAYEGEGTEHPLSMDQATMLGPDGAEIDGSCAGGYVINAPEKKTIHLMWNSDAAGAVPSRVAQGVHFKFIAK